MATHPLDSLSAEEISATSELLAKEHEIDGGWRYASIILREPPKTEVKDWKDGDPIVRRSLSVLWKKATNEVYEAVVNVTDGVIDSWTHIPDVTPNFTVDEYHDCDEAMRTNPDVRAAIQGRGLDPDLVLYDVWTYGGAVMPEKYRDRRLGWVDLWIRSQHGANPYAHPISGLKLLVDMNTLKLLEIEDHHNYGFPDVDGEYTPELRGLEQRTDVKPIDITQPEGTSFSVEGSKLKWLDWEFRVGFNYREGPVLYDVKFRDGDELRSIAYRMSFAEMIVPYRDASFDHYRRTAYDIGEWGFGYMCNSLELGCDCLGDITYLDAVLPDSKGEPYTIKNVVCIHEEDDGVLWKHVDPDAGSEVRRMRRFVVSVCATVANYEYLVYFRFQPDGVIEVEVRATGNMVTTPLEPGAPAPKTGTMVDEQTYAPFHQHFLVAKLDMDIDGEANRVVESDSFPAPIDESNPYGLDLNTESTVIASEKDAGRIFNWDRQRSWKVQSTTRKNSFGDPTSYKIVPGGSFPAMFDEASPILKRNPVIGQTLWVTRQHDSEMWPAGDYPTQSLDDSYNGMTSWISDDENLDGEDVVLWYVFGIHHITRTEDWPVMPVDKTSFELKPFGFFDRNPSLDFPRPKAHGEGDSCSASGEDCNCEH